MQDALLPPVQTVLDLFDQEQYRAVHCYEPPHHPELMMTWQDISANVRLSVGSLALPRGGTLLCGSRSRTGRTLRRGCAAELSALSGRGTAGTFAAAPAALLAAPCLLIHCRPGAAFCFTLWHTSIFVTFLDMLGLTSPLVRVRRFTTARHFILPSLRAKVLSKLKRPSCTLRS